MLLLIKEFFPTQQLPAILQKGHFQNLDWFDKAITRNKLNVTTINIDFLKACLRCLSHDFVASFRLLIEQPPMASLPSDS